MFCATFDAIAGLYLLWALTSKRIGASDPLSFGIRIRTYVDAELAASRTAELSGDGAAAFRHLERAHILGQRSTVQHVRVHMLMLLWALRNHKAGEVIGQLTRVIGAATKTWIGRAEFRARPQNRRRGLKLGCNVCGRSRARTLRRPNKA